MNEMSSDMTKSFFKTDSGHGWVSSILLLLILSLEKEKSYLNKVNEESVIVVNCVSLNLKVICPLLLSKWEWFRKKCIKVKFGLRDLFLLSPFTENGISCPYFLRWLNITVDGGWNSKIMFSIFQRNSLHWKHK